MSTKPRIAIIGDFPIGLINEQYKDIKSANAKWMHTFFQLLQDVEQFEFHWIALDKAYKTKNYFQYQGHHFYVLPGARLTIGLYTAYLYDRIQIWKCLKSIKPNLVHSWGTERSFGLAAKDFSGKKLLSAQGILTACKQRGPISAFERKQSLYEKGTFRAMNMVTAESPWALERIKEIAPNVNSRLWEYAADASFLSEERKLTKSPSCLLAGSRAPIKNVDLAIQAFSSSSLRHVTLYVAGQDKPADKKYPDNIIFLGYLTREKIKEYLGKVWALVHPSLADSCPNIVKEARIIGVPAIVTRDCGAKQYVEHMKSGCVVEPNNLEQFIQAVQVVTSNEETSLQMGSYGVDFCRKALSVDTMRTTILDIYNYILTESQK